MNTLIEKWQESMGKIGATRFPRFASAEGSYKAPNGHRPTSAKVSLSFEPAEDFSLDGTAVATMPHVSEYLNGIAYGVLDVLLAATSVPMFKVRVSITGIEADDVTSTEWAFRLASREATKLAVLEISGSVNPTV